MPDGISRENRSAVAELARVMLARFLRSPLSFSFLTRATLLGAGFVNTVLAARWFGAVAAAQMGFVSALLVVTAVVSLGGSDLYVLKTLSGQSERERAGKVLALALVRTVVGGVAVSCGAGVLFAIGLIDEAVGPLSASVLLALPVLVVVNAVRVLLFECVRARGRTQSYNLLLLLSPATTFLVLVSYNSTLDGASFAWVVIIGEFAGLFAVVALAWMGPLDLHIVGVTGPAVAIYERASRPFFVSGLSVVALNSDIFVLGFVLDTRELGTYVVASRLAAVARLPEAASAVGFAPRVAAASRTDGPAEALAIARQQTSITFPSTALIAIALVVAGPALLGFLGPTFEGAYPIMLVLLCGHITISFVGQTGLLLAMAGHERLQQWIFLASATVAIVVAIVLGSIVGPIGGGLAVLLATALRSVAGAFAVRRRLGGSINALSGIVMSGLRVPRLGARA